MAQRVDLSAFDRVRSMSDYDKAALEEARQRFMQAQALDMQKQASSIQQQKFDLEKQQFEEAKKAQDAGLMTGTGFQQQFYNRLIAQGKTEQQALNDVAKVFSGPDGSFLRASPFPNTQPSSTAEQEQAQQFSPPPEPMSKYGGQPTQKQVGEQPLFNQLLSELSNNPNSKAPSPTPPVPSQFNGGLEVLVEPTLKISDKNEIKEKLNKGLSAYKSMDGKTTNLMKYIDDADNNASFWNTGMMGQMLGNIGGTGANDMRSILDTIKSNVGFDELAQMRQNSPTGGALGAVSENENRLLQSVLGSLEQSQSTDQFKANLKNVKEQIEQSRARLADAYQRDLQTFGPQVMQNVPSPINNADNSKPNQPVSGSPKIGFMKYGYVFRGGNPNDKSRWEKVE